MAGELIIKGEKTLMEKKKPCSKGSHLPNDQARPCRRIRPEQLGWLEFVLRDQVCASEHVLGGAWLCASPA